MIKQSLNGLLLLFSFFLGRIPVWAFLAACLLYGRVSLSAGTALLFSIVIAKGLLYRWEYGRSVAYSTLRALWKSLIYPVLVFIIAEISFFAVIYLFMAGNVLDWQIAVAAVGVMACGLAAGALVKKAVPKRREAFFPGGPLVRFTVTLLWLYVLSGMDGMVFSVVAVLCIYLFEFLTTFGKERDMLLEGIR